MALNRQIHLYSLDTSCFYTDEEMVYHKRLVRIYSIRKNMKEKVELYTKEKYKAEKKRKLSDDTVNEKLALFSDALRRVNKLIVKYKNKLINLFSEFKESGKIRNLRPDTLVPKKITSMFESSTNRVCKMEINELTNDIMIVQTYYFEPVEDIVLDGFYYNGEKYELLTASAGQIRTKKFVVIKKSLYEEVKKTLMCGIDENIINECGGANTNKFLAYLALNNSATDLWEDFDIDKAIVVDDFETMIETEVDFIDNITYEITRKVMKVPIPHMDGCGIMLEKTRMFRAPWIKGLMVQMFYDKLLKEWGHNGDVIDIYGNKYNIFKDDIRYIFTKSQFKMWKYYNNWNDYKEKFKKHNCEASYCNVEEDNIPDAKLNYQMLQTLSDMTDDELQKIAQQSVENITNIGEDYRTTMKLLGVNECSNHMQRAISIYPELMSDVYNKETLKAVKKKLVKEAKSAKFAIQGKYTFVIPDLYAFCQWLFLGQEIPDGLLRNGEVYCNLYNDGTELDCLRSPHLYREHAVRLNTIDDEKKQWFVSKGIYTSTFDPISKVLMFDCDGDKLLVVKDKTIVNVAKRNMVGIVPLYYEMKKAHSEMITKRSLYEGLDKSYRGGKIGIYSNDISKIWNSGKVNEMALTVIKLLCMENNFSIDQAKTLYMPERPSDKNNLIRKFTNKKVPHFFIYAKDKSETNVEKINDSVVNRLEKIIPSTRLKFSKTIGRIDYTMLMYNRKFQWDDNYNNLVEFYDKLNQSKYLYYDMGNEDVSEDWNSFAFVDIKRRIMEQFSEYDVSLIADILVYYLYNIRKSSTKFTLWASFGDIIYSNIQTNTAKLGNICPVCGKRFKKKSNVQKTCSDECSNVLKMEYDRDYSAKNREKS